MRARACLFLMIAGVMLVTAGPGFGRPMIGQDDPHLSWGVTYGAGGPLEGLVFDDKPTVCATWGNPAYPVLHLEPENANGTPADCTRPGVYASADKDISVKDAMTGAALADSTLLFEDYDVDLHEEITTLELEARAEVYSIVPGCTECTAFVISSDSYYAENIDCECVPDTRVSLSLDLSGGTDVLHPVTASVVAASDTNRQSDLFTATLGENVEVFTTPLKIGKSGKFSVIITVGAAQYGVGVTIGTVLVNPVPIVLPDFETFDPLESTETTPRGFSDGDDVAGWYTTSGGATEGFELLSNGTIKAPIIDPNDNLHSTAAFGINNAGTIVGQYENVSGGIDTYHGFMLSPGGAFSTYDIGKPGVSTGIQAINNNGDFAGDFGSGTRVSHGFLNSGGNTVTFGVPGLNTYPQAMNDSKTIVGVYLDKSGNYQSFQRTADGTLTTFNFPGAVSTHAEGINNAGTIDGYFTNKAGKTHGFFGPLGLFVRYDLAGAAGTSARGINKAGTVTGSFADSGGVLHGFEAQLCAANVSSAVTVTQGAISYDSTIREYVQTITLKNTGATPIAGPLYVLFKNLTRGVFPASKGSSVSLCIAPGTPLIKVVLPTPNLSPGGTASVNVDFFDGSKSPISYTARVLAGTSTP